MNETPLPLRVRAITALRPGDPASERVFQRLGIMTIYFQDGMPKARNFSARDFAAGHLFGASKALQAIGVHDQRQRQGVFLSKDQRFPAGAFLPLAVGEEAVDTARLLLKHLPSARPDARDSP